MTSPAIDTAALGELYDYLTPAERAEVDHYATQLTTGGPHTDYQRDPIRWAVEKLGIAESTLRWSANPGYSRHAWDGTPEPLATLYQAIAEGRDVGCESGTGTGKSFSMAVLILWFLAVFEGARVFSFAPKEDQLRLYIWTEIGKLWPMFRVHFPNATLTDLRLQMKAGSNDWGAVGYSVGVVVGESVSTKASGMHAPHMMLVYEETPGIPLQVLEAGENACTAPHNFRVAIGNPNHRLDALHRFCASPGVVAIRMSALDHPNVVSGNPSLIPGAISGVSIDRRRLRYGETSPVYQSRVRGVSPEQASDALIRLEWLKRSAERFTLRQYSLGRRVTGKGVDVANSEHGDRAAIADFYGNALPKVRAFQCPDANALGRQVRLEMDAGETKPERVGVDTIGVGSGTFNELWRLKARVVDLKASRSPVARTEKAPDGQTYEWAADGNEFRHSRDQWYWQLREDLRLDRIDVEWDDELVEELTTPTFVDEPRTIILAKDDIKALLGRSPDKADAVVMGNWVRERKAPNWHDAPPHEQGAHDPAVQFRTKDGKPARWIGPEADRVETNGYAAELPVGI